MKAAEQGEEPDQLPYSNSRQPYVKTCCKRYQNKVI
jgi:hypothetical protein